MVIDQIAGKSARRAIVEQNKHLWPGGGRFRAVCRECQNGLNLFARHAEFLHELVNTHILKVFKYGGDGHASTFKHHTELPAPNCRRNRSKISAQTKLDQTRPD